MFLRLIFVLLSFSFFSFSHDLWIEKEGNNFKLLYGHKFSSHGGDKLMEYNPDFVKYLLCYEGGKVYNLDFERVYPINISAKCDEIFFLFSSGYWTKTVYGTKNVPKEGEKQVVKSWLSFESVKFLNNFKGDLKPYTEELEIVCLSDLNKIKKGDKLRLRVFFKGKPLKDVPVAYFGNVRGTTYEEGNINITIKNEGFQMITASYTEKGDGVKADEVIYTTNLNFYLKE